MALLDTITIRLQSDVAQFQSGMAQAGASLGTFSTTATSSRHAVNVLRAGLTGLAIQATGVAGPIGRVAQALLLFSGGGALVLGVAAGIGVIALAYQHMAKAAEEAEAAERKLAEFRTSHLQAIGQIGSLEQQGNATQRLRELQALFAEQTRDLTTLSGVLGDATFDSAKLADAMLGKLGPAAQATAQQIGALQAAIDRINFERWHQFNEEQATFLRQIGELTAAVQLPEVKPLQLINPDQIDLLDQAKDEVRKLQGALDSLNASQLRQFKQEFSKLGKGLEPQVTSQMRDLGHNAIRSFVAGIADGTQDFFDLMAGIFKSFLVGSITDAIGGLLFGGGKKIGASKGSGFIPELSPQAVGPGASFSLSLDVSNLPPPMTPFDVARDQLWQRVFRESAIVASDQGFRGRR